MTRRRGLIAVVVTTVLLALWVTSGASHVEIIEGGAARIGTQTDGELEEGPPKQPAPTGGPGDRSQEFPAWVEVLSTVLASVFLAALTAWLLWLAFGAFQRRRRRRRARPQSTPDHVVHDAFLDDAHRELSTAAELQLGLLQSGEPRNAIVACWVALEDAVERAGVARDAAETSSEFTARIVSAITVDGGSVSALATLYREARFSRHPLGEPHRDRAIALLTGLSAELRRARRAPAVAANQDPA